MKIVSEINCIGRAITHPAAIPQNTALPVQPRAIGAVELGVKSRSGATQLGDLRQAGSLKCLFPRRDGAGLDAVLVNTAGGVTGGDRFTCYARTLPETELTLTTQAAERAYCARGLDVGHVANHLTLENGSRLNWLPQETILFQGCGLQRNMRIDMAADARLLFCEPLVFGRLAMGETLRNAHFNDRVEIYRDGALTYLDAVHLKGDVQAQLDRPGVADGARAMATIVYIGPDAEAHLAPIRGILPRTAGASLRTADTLVLRLLAADGYALRETLIPALRRLYCNDLPRCWMI